MHTTAPTHTDKCNNCCPDNLSATIRAIRSKYSDFADDECFLDTPMFYFLMTTEMEILGVTDNPSDEDEGYCVAANQPDLDFLSTYAKNWPNANPHYWELEIYRKYYRANIALHGIGSDHSETSYSERLNKICNFKRLP